jgi:hypothetical protein
MTKLVIAACCIFMLNAASAAEITASYMYAICVQGDPSCGTYLRGVYDGVRTGKDIICPRGDIEDEARRGRREDRQGVEQQGAEAGIPAEQQKTGGAEIAGQEAQGGVIFSTAE